MITTQLPQPGEGPAPTRPRGHGPGTPHTPLRPLWVCRADGQPWPCGEARLLLTLEFDDNHAGLSIYLAGLFAEAARDLYHLNPHDGPAPEDLFRRFVGWGRYRPGDG